MSNYNLRRVRRIAAIVVGALALALVALQPNVATADQETYLLRTADCLQLLLNDPARHAQECAEGYVPSPPESLVEQPVGGGRPSEDPCASDRDDDDMYGGGSAVNAGSAAPPVDPCGSYGLLAPLLLDWLGDTAAIAPQSFPEDAHLNAAG